MYRQTTMEAPGPVYLNRLSQQLKRNSNVPYWSRQTRSFNRNPIRAIVGRRGIFPLICNNLYVPGWPSCRRHVENDDIISLVQSDQLQGTLQLATRHPICFTGTCNILKRCLVFGRDNITCSLFLTVCIRFKLSVRYIFILFRRFFIQTSQFSVVLL